MLHRLMLNYFRIILFEVPLFLFCTIWCYTISIFYFMFHYIHVALYNVELIGIPLFDYTLCSVARCCTIWRCTILKLHYLMLHFFNVAFMLHYLTTPLALWGCLYEISSLPKRTFLNSVSSQSFITVYTRYPEIKLIVVLFIAFFLTKIKFHFGW